MPKKRTAAPFNPAIQFLGDPEQIPQADPDPVQPIETEAPGEDVYTHTDTHTHIQAKRATAGQEAKSARLQLLITPSLKAALQDQSRREGRSVNDMINSMIENYLNR